jgi:hypothetical protein
LTKYGSSAYAAIHSDDWAQALRDSDPLNYRASVKEHDLIETGDDDAFPAICDMNGEVVLAYCRVCRKGEVELQSTCPGHYPNEV